MLHRFNERLKTVYSKFFLQLLQFLEKFCSVRIFIIPHTISSFFERFSIGFSYGNRAVNFKSGSLLCKSHCCELACMLQVIVILKQVAVSTIFPPIRLNDLARHRYTFHHLSSCLFGQLNIFSRKSYPQLNVLSVVFHCKNNIYRILYLFLNCQIQYL